MQVKIDNSNLSAIFSGNSGPIELKPFVNNFTRQKFGSVGVKLGSFQ